MSSRSGFADTFSAGTTTTTNAGVRPRRLISFTDDDEDSNGRQLLSTGLSTTMLSSETPTVRSRGATPSPRPSRTVSPIPMSHPSRVSQSPSHTRTAGNSLGGFNRDWRSKGDITKPSSRAALDFLDASWSSLQSLASSLLGSDIARPTTNGAPRTHARKPSRPDLYMRVPPRTSAAATWGPAGSPIPEIGAGTQEERQALLQAKKREALLLADTDPTWSLKTRHKRRDSSEQASQSRIHPDQDGEALVYVHQVQPTDSITGVTIQYGCQPAIFRKANGFWPSDSIQGRKTVLLPVDCCSVKGRPVRHREETDLLGEDPRRRSIEDLSGSSIAPVSVSETQTFLLDQAQVNTETESENDRIWKHESWVQIDGFPAPVEIGRIPRRALGFFPRSRRKSISYSDADSHIRGREQTPTMHSSSSSTIQPAPSQSPDFSQRQRYADPSESRNSRGLKPGARHKRQRSGLELSGTGVGTLDRTVIMPGPAMDGLSKFFADHLPNLVPTQSSPNFDSRNGNASNAVSSNPTSLDSIGGAVEGWVRKMTSRAKSTFGDLQQGTTSSPSQVNGNSGLGDLIELNDGVESGNSSGLLAGPGWNADFNRSGVNLSNGSSLRGRFPSASPSTSRTRAGLDRVKDD